MRSTLLKALTILILPLMLVSCFRTPGGSGNIGLGEIEDRLTADEEKIANFALGEPHGFFARNDRGNGPPFNCSFMRSNAVIGGDTLSLILSEEGGRIRWRGIPYVEQNRLRLLFGKHEGCGLSRRYFFILHL